LRNLKTGK
ncbi:unnamed protein product, partial [Allacma fusca]